MSCSLSLENYLLVIYEACNEDVFLQRKVAFSSIGILVWGGGVCTSPKKHCLNYSHGFSSLGYLSNKIWGSKYVQGLSCGNSFLWLKFFYLLFPLFPKQLSCGMEVKGRVAA